MQSQLGRKSPRWNTTFSSLALALLAVLVSASSTTDTFESATVLPTSAVGTPPSVASASPASLPRQQVYQQPPATDALSYSLSKTWQADEGWKSQVLFSQGSLYDPDPNRFWTTPPKSPTVSVVEIDGQEIVSVSPGPEDLVNVIVQLREDPVALAMMRALGRPRAFTAAEAQVVRDFRREVFVAQISALQAMERKQISFTVRHRYSHIFNGIAGSVKTKDLVGLALLPQVKRVYLDYQVHVTLNDSVPLIGAPKVWELQDSQGRTLTGHGVTVAVIDTGIDYNHPDLGGCLGPLCRVIGGYDFVNNDADPMDDHGHGTHVSGIVGANGAMKGVAPDVKLMGFKVLNEFGSGSFSNVIAGIERATDPD